MNWEQIEDHIKRCCKAQYIDVYKIEIWYKNRDVQQLNVFITKLDKPISEGGLKLLRKSITDELAITLEEWRITTNEKGQLRFYNIMRMVK